MTSPEFSEGFSIFGKNIDYNMEKIIQTNWWSNTQAHSLYLLTLRARTIWGYKKKLNSLPR